MPDARLDRWVQRVTVATMVMIALVLMGVGIALYAPGVLAASNSQVVSK